MVRSTPDYRIAIEPGHAVLDGVLRLNSALAYESVLEEVRDGVAQARDMFVIDVRGLVFLNSSGITALTRLVLLARDRRITLVFNGQREVPWQRRTLVTLRRLYSDLVVDLD